MPKQAQQTNKTSRCLRISIRAATLLETISFHSFYFQLLLLLSMLLIDSGRPLLYGGRQRWPEALGLR